MRSNSTRSWAIFFAREVLGFIFFMEHVIPRLALLLFVLMLPPEEDRFSADYLLSSRHEKGSSRPTAQG